MIWIASFWALLGIAAICAAVWGRRPEAGAAALFTAAAVASRLLAHPGRHSWLHVETGELAIDAVVFAGLVYLVLRTDREWPIWSTAFQFVSLSAHLAKAVDPRFPQLAYALMENFSGKPTLVILLWAIWRHRRERPRRWRHWNDC